MWVSSRRVRGYGVCELHDADAPSIVYVANLVVVFTKASASASRINEVLNCVPSITDEGNEPVALPEPNAMGNAALRSSR